MNWHILCIFYTSLKKQIDDDDGDDLIEKEN
jgi:hypothetical protein